MKEYLCLCVEVSLYIGLSFINFFFFYASLPITAHHHVCYSPKSVRIRTGKPKNTSKQRKSHRQEMPQNVELSKYFLLEYSK